MFPRVMRKVIWAEASFSPGVNASRRATLILNLRFMFDLDAAAKMAGAPSTSHIYRGGMQMRSEIRAQRKEGGRSGLGDGSAPLTMSTLEIAELTGKVHKNVVADARKMLDELGFHSAEFSAQYRDASGKANRVFNLPKRETMVPVSGYSTKLRARIIDRWMELESGRSRRLSDQERGARSTAMTASRRR